MFNRVYHALIAFPLLGMISTGVVHALPISGAVDGFAPGWIWNGMPEWDDPGLSAGRAHAGGPGGYGSYTFTGTGVEIYGVVGPSVEVDGRVHRIGSLRISIDGKTQSTETVRKPSADFDVLLGRVTGLSKGVHVVEVAPVDGWAVVESVRVIDPAHPALDPASAGHDAGGGPLGTPVAMIHVGGPAVGDWRADPGAYGGTPAQSSDDINTAGVTDAGPAALYQSERWGPCGYMFPGLTPNAEYNVRLDFAETFYTQPRMRLFDIAINNDVVVHDFDVFSSAGGKDRPFVMVLHARADAQGQLSVAFLKGKADNPVICAVAVYKP